MNKLIFNLLALLLTVPALQADEKNTINSLTKSIVTCATLIVGSCLITKAAMKGYERARQEYFLRDSLENLNLRAKNHIENVERTIGSEITLERDTELLNLLRSKYTGELFPLCYAHELIIKMKNDIIFDKCILTKKIARSSEEEKDTSIIQLTTQLITQLCTLEENLNNMQEFLFESYEYKTEKSEFNNLHTTIANYHHTNHTTYCTY